MTIPNQQKKGIITMYLLAFAGIFLILLSGLAGFILMQLRQSSEKVAWNQALNIAEAGVNYYRWCINNDVEQNCLTEKNYYDASGNLLGKFSLEASSTVSCGQDIKKDIISTGQTDKFPQIKRKISALYGRSSVARYSYILKDSVWIGADHEIRGPYHSNAGVRMDGSNQSIMTSAIQEWNCTSTFGCSPCPTSNGCHVQGTNCMCPGVFTTTLNGNPGLFNFPVPPFDFDGITFDLAEMKRSAIADGIYLPPATTTNPLGKGYNIKFKSDGTFEVWLITGLSATWGYYYLPDGWHNDYFTIASSTFFGNYAIPSACSAIFVEDDVWPEGIIKGKVALASANLIDSNIDTDVVLTNNIDYSTTTGADGFALVAERNILIGPQSPNQMTLRGIFTAQKGRFGRSCYVGNTRNSLEIYGSVISRGRVGTQWSGGSCDGSGYTSRESYFDSNLIYNPPPFVPYIESDFKVVDWKEIK